MNLKPGDARAWLDTTTAVAIQRTREGWGRSAQDLLCTGAPEVGKCVWCGGCGGPPLRVGRRLTPSERETSQRPRHKNHVHWTQEVTTVHALHHILSSAHTHTHATAR